MQRASIVILTIQLLPLRSSEHCEEGMERSWESRCLLWDRVFYLWQEGYTHKISKLRFLTRCTMAASVDTSVKIEEISQDPTSIAEELQTMAAELGRIRLLQGWGPSLDIQSQMNIPALNKEIVNNFKRTQKNIHTWVWEGVKAVQGNNYMKERENWKWLSLLYLLISFYVY